MPNTANHENYGSGPFQEITTSKMSENNLDMSRINRLRDSERRKKVEIERNERIKQQMSSYEGMNKLAQLEGELTSKLNGSNNSNLNGMDNPGFANDNPEFSNSNGHSIDQLNDQNPNKNLNSNKNTNSHSQSFDNQSTASISANHPHANLQTLPPLASLDEAIHALDTAAELLNDEEDISAELSALRSILNRDEFTQSLNLYNATVSNWTSPLGVVTSPHDDGKENGSSTSKRDIFSNTGVNRHTSFKQYVEPLTSATDRLVNEVRNNLSIVYQSEAQQLLSLLYSPHLQVLFPTHDEVALMREGDLNENQIVDISRNQYNSASNNTNDNDMRNTNFTPNSNFSNQNQNYNSNPVSRSRNTTMGDSDLQIVRISKTVDALGATIKNEGDAIVISRIITGGLIDKTGQLGEGDEIIKVNGTPVRGRNVDNVSNLIACATGDIELVIRPNKNKDANGKAGMSHVEKDAQALHVRALFEYDPFDDLYVPCRELALKFDKGDILHITDRSDDNWWQAFRDGETGITLAGLIPSSNFERTRQNLLRELDKSREDNEQDEGTGFCKKRKKKNKEGGPGEVPGAKGKGKNDQTFQTYEEMALFQQPDEKKRPIIMIGANHCGRHEIRQRLLDEEQHRFLAAVPHTTRNVMEGEVNGRDYYFVTKDVFLNDIADFKFIEHGVYEKHYYGTSVDSIRHIINAGKICILNLHPPSLPALMKTELMPYIIFISAPNVETLRDIFAKQKRSVTEAELKETVEHSKMIEKDYSCYFDKVLRLTDIDRTYDDLIKCINKLDTQPQWVPSIWLKHANNY